MARKQKTFELPEGNEVREDDVSSDANVEPITKIEAIYDTEPPPFAFTALEAVRMRPGMYIGDVGVRGLHHLFQEILDNAVDEVLAGHCTEIDVILGDDYTLSVIDNGRGIPKSIVVESGKNAIEHVFTELTFRHRTNIQGDDCPKVSGGLHGIGAEVVNALSERLECLVNRDGKRYRIRFERGESVTPLEIVGDCEPGEHGTKVTWLADKLMFPPALTESGGLAYDREIIARRCRELAYHIPGARIRFHDQLHNKSSETFHSPHGVVDLMPDLSRGRNVFPEEPVVIRDVVKGARIEVAFQFSDAPSETLLSFVNTAPTPENGKHVTGFRRALTRSVNRFGITQTGQKGETKCHSLTAIVSVLMREPKYNPSDRTRLDSPEVEGYVFSAVYAGLKKHWAEHPEHLPDIIEHRKPGAEDTPAIR